MNTSSTTLFDAMTGGRYVNPIGRTTGIQLANGQSPNFFQKRWNSAENALGTTGAAIASRFYDTAENLDTDIMNGRHRDSLNDIYKKYGYKDADDYYNAKNTAEKEIFGRYGFDSDDYWQKHSELWNPAGTNSAAVDALDANREKVINSMSQADADRIRQFDAIQDELKGKTSENAAEATKKAKAYEDYRKNNYVSKKINQDRGKFLGSAVNTLSTGVDLAGLSVNPITNAVQGGIEGVADELEQNGFENFDAGRAAQNAAIGATTGLVTGALNKGISNALAKNGGNLFKGNNAITKGLNDLGSKTGVGRALSTVATGAGRGAVSGAVGGATGAGLSAAMNNGNIIESAIEGAKQGARQGAVAGGIMSGANMAISKTPGIGDFYNDLQSARTRWDQSGSDFDERLTNTLNSGESAVGDWLNRKTTSKLINSVGNVGNSIRNVDGEDYQTALNRALDEGLSGPELGDELAKYSGLPERVDMEDIRALTGKDQTLSKVINGVENEFIDFEGRAPSPEEVTGNLWNEIRARYAQEINYEGPEPSPYTDTPTNKKYATISPLGGRTEYSPEEVKNLITEYENYESPKILSGNSTDEVAEAMGDAGVKLSEIYSRLNGGEFDPYSRESYADFEKWLNNTKTELNNTPTTAKGWAKRASERIIEDANKRGVGLSINDVNNDMPDDVRNLRISDNMATQEVTPQLDTWDRIAQNAGYDNYDQVIESYLRANPGVELNPRGAAGQILTWLDENPNTPTTAGEWARRAGQRIVEDANERGVGMSIKDTSQENPQTEIYRTLTGQKAQTEQDLPEVFEPEARNQIEAKNKFQLVGKQLKNAGEHQKRRGLYGSLDAKTASRAIETKAPETLTKLGYEPENYLEAAKISNYVNQTVSDLAKESGVKVNIPDMPQRLQTATEDVVFSTTDAPNKYNRAIRQIVADGSTPDEYSASYLLEKSREFGNKAAKIKDNSPDAKALRTAYTNAKFILRDEAANALANANITGDQTNDYIAEGLAKMGAKQKAIDYITEPTNGKAPNAREYVKRTAVFEQARDMGTQMEAEKLTRSASKEPTRVSTKLWRATGLEEPLEIVLNNTVAPLAGLATKAVGGAVEGVGNIAARLGGNSGTTTATPTPNPTTTNSNYNPSTQIYNAIGRTEGARNARAANYLAAAAQEAEVVPKAPRAGVATLEDMVPTPTTSTTSVYDSIYSLPSSATTTATTPTYSTIEDERAVYFFPPTGDYWADMLSRGMRRAKEAEDYDALGSLYQMYQSAISSAQDSTATTSQQKLTATQQRANAAMDSLERLSDMTPDLAYNLSNIPVIGNIATFGGNDYEAEAKSLAQQIGYMVSGSNIRDSEAENIGKAYVPQPWDNEQVRQNKLRRAYNIIQQYQNGYSS